MRYSPASRKARTATPPASLWDSGPCDDAVHPEPLLQDGLARLPLSVVLLESLLGDDTPLVQQELPRIRHAPEAVLPFRDAEGGVMLVHLRIQHPQLLDDPAALVGQQREGDAVGGGETGQHVHWVVADAKDGDVVPLEVGQVPLQFD
jgi:hypothetical protein